METRDYLANRTSVPEGTLVQLLFETVDRFGDKLASRRILEGGGFREFTFSQQYVRAREVCLALWSLGLERGDRVAILSENRPEWTQVDFGAICAGTPLVPIHFNLTPGQVRYILKDSGAKILLVSTPDLLLKARDALSDGGDSPRVVAFDPADDEEDVTPWEHFLAMGGSQGLTDEEFRRRALEVQPQHTSTILYTSGTTGDPKGVELTHRNLYTNCVSVGMHVPFSEEDSTLSFLPLSHSLQRMADYLFFSKGMLITYGRSLKTIPEDLCIARPTKVVGAPRFYEKTYQKVMEQTGAKGLIVRWAREVGEAWAEEKLSGRKPTWVLESVYAVAYRLVFKKLHEGLGGRIRFFISGSAPLAPNINKFFFSAGIQILEGYGLSETSPVATANSLADFQIGTVGTPIPGTEIKIAQDGEILIRGPQVMRGYFNLPDETEKAIDAEGWFHSGDIGEIDEEGHLRITDRKKNLLVTAGGKNVAPAPIENRVKGNRFVDQVVMIGEAMPFPALLVVPAFQALGAWARSSGIAFSSQTELLTEPKVQDLLKHEVFGCLGELASWETPKKIGLLQEEFTIEGGILTPNLKVKRRVVRERYGALISQLYDPENRHRDVFVDGG